MHDHDHPEPVTDEVTALMNEIDEGAHDLDEIEIGYATE